MDKLVSIVVPTRNSSQFLEECLTSIRGQSYRNIELIVVDNFSTDTTPGIARRYADLFFAAGPERSAQRNLGARNSQGSYLFFVDSDMWLSENVVSACVSTIEEWRSCKAVIVPEESFGEGFWARCKRLERSFYVGVDWIEAARFFNKEAFMETGGYDESMVSGEDWDLSQRLREKYMVGRIQEFIFHNEGSPTLRRIVKKKYRYAMKFGNYTATAKGSASLKKQTGVISRYRLFFREPGKLFRDPMLGLGMLFMKTCEFSFGAMGYLISKLRRQQLIG
jgi:glycosyltransferase involved in cell wall biosynthesis